MNPVLARQALEKVQNPHVLVNMVARRVRQLTNGNGGSSAPLIADVTHLGTADIALLEIIEGKMSFELPEIIPLTRPTGRGRNIPKNWQTNHAKAA
jgi:DNA-directed RNA polymerase subunit K/omega